MPDRNGRKWMSTDEYFRLISADWASVTHTRPGQGLDRRPGRAAADGDAFDEAAAEAKERRAGTPRPTPAVMRPVKPRPR